MKIVFIVFMLLIGTAGFCEPVVDGVAAPGEYTQTVTQRNLQLSAFFTADKVFLAVTGRTKGWVSVGVGSKKMDKALIYMGFFSREKGEFTEQVGRRHTHSDIEEKPTVLSWAVKETGDYTTLEVVLDRAKVLSPGQNQLDYILAMGSADSFRAPHSARAGDTLPVK